jgi:hypothetical protein
MLIQTPDNADALKLARRSRDNARDHVTDIELLPDPVTVF